MHHLPRQVRVAVIGGGQAGLAMGYYLRRGGLRPGDDFIILDDAGAPGGAWPRMWDGLRLFSPAAYSSLPGWMMPPWDDATRGFPPRDHVVDYLTRYEQRYDLMVQRPCRVSSIERSTARSDAPLIVRTARGDVAATVVVSATGTWTQPFLPHYPGSREFAGRQLHTVQYRRPEEFTGQRVVVVGGGNSGAQVVAEVSAVTETVWVTNRTPKFLPDDVDGRALFAAATSRVEALREGGEHPGVGSLGDIVMIRSVREARDRGALTALPMFDRLTETGPIWPDGTLRPADVLIWCTGFRPALRHLRGLDLSTRGGHIDLAGPAGTQSVDEERLHLIGYGDWSGAASATLIGAGRTARDTSRVVLSQLASLSENGASESS